MVSSLWNDQSSSRMRCDERLSIVSPEFLDDDLNDVDHQRATLTEIMVWAETATTYDLSETLDAMMRELKKAVNAISCCNSKESKKKRRVRREVGRKPFLPFSYITPLFFL
jgi:hypothetical protein